MLFANQISVNDKTTKIPVGIHSACTVTSVEVGDNYIDFNYEDSKNRVNNKRVWFPDIEKSYPRDGESKEEAYKRRQVEDLAHVVKHMHIFMSPEEINAFAAPDFPTFCAKAAASLTPKLSSKKVNLKLIYDKDGYSVFGRYPDYIEEHVEGEDPTLQYTKWERENRITPPNSPTEVESNDDSIIY